MTDRAGTDRASTDRASTDRAGTDRAGFAFVIEQVLGHITHGENLRRHVPDDPSVDAHWVLAPYAVEGRARHVPIYRSNWTARVGVRSRRLLRDVLRHHPIDAVFFHTQVPALLCHDYVRRLPSVISLDATPRQYDELGEFYAHDQGPAFVERLKSRAARASFDAADHLVTWSAWAKDGLVDGYGVDADKITVIPPGVTVDEWRAPSERRAADGPTKILFVGGDLERKGGSVLIDAFRTLDDLDVELHLVTTAEVPDLPRVVVHRGLQPNTPELRAIYHDCDVFALPTRGDCLPMVLSEAGAAGLPLVSTDVAAIPEVVRDGETGILVPVGESSALAHALRTLVERPDERRAMGARALAHVERHYDTATNTRRLLDIMKQVAGRLEAAP